jgi:hypothetical protein
MRRQPQRYCPRQLAAAEELDAAHEQGPDHLNRIAGERR